MVKMIVWALLIAAPIVLCNHYLQLLNNLMYDDGDYEPRIRQGMGVNMNASMYNVRVYYVDNETCVSLL